MAGLVSVAIPVLNGAEYLDEVLTAIRAQKLDREVEIVIVDSGSTDGSIEIAGRHGAQVHGIDKRDFSHGGTRNLLMQLSSGEHVAFLTQDATPASPRWLAALLEGFEQADDVAAVFGPHDARPDASHMIKSEMERHFASWGGGQAVDIQRLERTPEALAAYRKFPGQLTFLSDVNCCIARSAWERVPYREVPYAEDQLLGRELIEAGYAKVFHPEARVLHSHDYAPADFFKRYFDEFRSLREVLGHVQPWGPVRTLNDVRGLVGADKRWLEQQGVHGIDLVGPLAVSARHWAIRMAGAIVGTRADRIPERVRGELSLERRSTFVEHDVSESALLDDEAAFDPAWPWEFVRREYPQQPIRIDPRPPRGSGPLTINWVVPPWKVGSGGITTIFRLIQQLEQRGHSCAIYVFDPFGWEKRPAHKLRAEIVERFIPIDAPVFTGLDDFAPCDVCFATQWWTAWAVRDLPGCGEKVYLVQDDEPQFYATGAESIFAEETYRMGYRCIAYTPWMAEILRERYGAESRHFECGTDLDVYPFGDEHGREPGLIAVYARRETERRAVDLAVAGLMELFERRPGIRVVVFGSNVPPSVPFPCEDWGVRSPQELARLYRRASAGIVFSLTTHSLVAQEMMASGLPLVELNGPSVTSELGEPGERAELVDPRPDAIADSLERLLDDRNRAGAMAKRAREFVEKRTWERAGDQVEEALYDFVSRPARRPGRTPAASTR
jgi:glycosyltransferase involved in cell wall biosynthesis